MRHCVELGCTHVRHLLVIRRIVGNMARRNVFFETADTVHESGHPRCDPGASERLGMTREGLLLRAAFPALWRIAADRFVSVDVRDSPGLGGVREVAVREQYHGRHVPQGNSHGLDGHVETLAGRGGGQHRQWRIRIAAVNGLVEIGLLGLCRQARRGSTALPVHDHERQFRAHGEPHGFGLERDARTRARRNADHAAIRGADSGADRSDLILRLERADAQFAQVREPMQERRGRRNRVGTEHHGAVGEFAGGRDTERERLGARDAPVGACRELGGWQPEPGDARRKLLRFAIGVTRAECPDVGVADRGLPREPARDPGFHRVEASVEHPEHEAERVEIFAASALALAQAEVLDRFQRQVGDVGHDDLEIGQRAVFPRVPLIAGFRKISCREPVAVQNDQRAPVEERQADFQRRGIEGNQHVGRVACRGDRVTAEVDLVGGNTECRAGRRPNLRRVIGKSRKIGTGQRRRNRELRSHELDAVSRVTGEANDD